MDSVICSACCDECFAEIAQRRLGRGADILFSHHDANETFIGKDYLAVANFVFLPAKGMDTKFCAMDAQGRLLRHLAVGKNAAGRRIPSSKLNASSFADQTAASIATDEIGCITVEAYALKESKLRAPQLVSFTTELCALERAHALVEVTVVKFWHDSLWQSRPVPIDELVLAEYSFKIPLQLR
jgi:hypothetical protein